ncbi:hypothetical protein [Nocardioides antri]|uniref:Exo-alpha-sialidase n=1 Tax=Nocardioides antri TaxID=2607659 RepID=A0A5B1M8Y7_9ACTN|nr:hypothetical protein [Nocardioides antri]KAA1428906.1 hypothetical protein F0U47_01420 [Nocardioides antri]
MKAALAPVLLLACGVVAGCGDQTSGAPPGSAGPARWQTEHLRGELSVDFPTLLVSDGEDTVVLMLSDEGVLQSHVSEGGEAFVAGEPLELGERYAALGDVVRLDDGSWFALGNAGAVEVRGDTEPTYDPMALRSDDGLTWERVDVTGFTDAVELTALEVVDDRIVAVGGYRTLKDPSSGGFEARTWTSDDGRAFEEVPLPDVPDYQGYDDESYAGDVVMVDGDLLVSGRIGDTAVLWRSEDAGETWARVEERLLRDAYSISGLHARGSTVVATAATDDAQAIRSDDGGFTWEPVTSLPVNEEADGWAPLWSGAGRFFTLTGVDDISWSTPEVCYADLDQCGRDPGPRVVASEDGAEWTAVDLPGGGEVDEIVGTGDGRLLVMAAEQDGVAVHTWPAGTDLPEADEPAVPETVDLVTLADGEEPEVGVRYHLPLYTHCGIEQISFGGEPWRRTDDGPGYETGAGDAAPEGWPVPEGGGNVYGYATVRGDATLEYTAEDGTVLATYERGGRPFWCD